MTSLQLQDKQSGVLQPQVIISAQTFILKRARDVESMWGPNIDPGVRTWPR